MSTSTDLKAMVLLWKDGSGVAERKVGKQRKSRRGKWPRRGSNTFFSGCPKIIPGECE
jgi:hypothetical protein